MSKIIHCDACKGEIRVVVCKQCKDLQWDQLSAALAAMKARAEAAETSLRELTDAASAHANEHGCGGFLGARLHEARRVLAAAPPSDDTEPKP